MISIGNYKYSNYRKPRKGMWQIVREKWTLENCILEDSFYCGDAAGRPNEWVKGFKKQGIVVYVTF